MAEETKSHGEIQTDDEISFQFNGNNNFQPQPDPSDPLYGTGAEESTAVDSIKSLLHDIRTNYSTNATLLYMSLPFLKADALFSLILCKRVALVASLVRMSWSNDLMLSTAVLSSAPVPYKGSWLINRETEIFDNLLLLLKLIID